MADGIFEAAVAVHVIHDRQFASCVPISPAHVRLQFFRRTSSQRSASQHAIDGFELAVVGAVQHDGKFVIPRNGQQVRVSKI